MTIDVTFELNGAAVTLAVEPHHTLREALRRLGMFSVHFGSDSGETGAAAVLYDEPTTGLDPANSRRIGQLIVDLRARLGVTSVVVTHELDHLEGLDRVIVFDEGRVIADDAPGAAIRRYLKAMA